MVLFNLLWMTGITLALVIAALAYRHGSLKGKGVFGLGVITAVGLLVLAAVACSALPDSVKSERQIATEAVECLQAGYEGFVVDLLGGKDALIAEAVRESTKEQLIRERDQVCGKGDG